MGHNLSSMSYDMIIYYDVWESEHANSMDSSPSGTDFTAFKHEGIYHPMQYCNASPYGQAPRTHIRLLILTTH